MYLLFNPFCLRKALHDYISKYAKQARVIVHPKATLPNYITKTTACCVKIISLSE
mgnify:CR=1 FL=1